ncbi:MAG: methionyl-tRNA formyltransferase [Limisphaerales bacterium]
MSHGDILSNGKLRIIFMGTAELSCPSLEALAGWSGCDLVAVITQPDRPKGRELRLEPPPVKVAASRAGLTVLQPERARDEVFVETIRQLNPDLIVVVAYGQILPQSLLDVPRFGCMNVHTSLLPKYRGAAPIQWAILHDEPETGVTIMKMDAGLDTGPILTQAPTPIRPTDTSESLHDRLAILGAELLLRTIPQFVAGGTHPQPQPTESASYAPKIKKEDGHIDWDQAARAVWNRVRALAPWPGAFSLLPRSPRPLMLKFWQAEVATVSGKPGEILASSGAGIVVGCGDQALRVLTLQREGGRRLTAREFLSGLPLKPGTRLE